jgi:hypothetical protein
LVGNVIYAKNRTRFIDKVPYAREVGMATLPFNRNLMSPV